MSCGCGSIFDLDAWKNPGEFCKSARAFLTHTGIVGAMVGATVIVIWLLK